MIVLRDREYSFRGTRALFQAKSLVNNIFRRGKTKYQLAREAINTQNKIVGKIAGTKTKLEGAALNPSKTIVNGTKKMVGGIAKNPSTVLMTPVGSAAGAGVLTGLGVNPGAAFAIASPTTTALGLGYGKLVKGVRDGLRRSGWKLSRSNNKAIEKTGRKITEVVDNLRGANKGYKKAVDRIIDNPVGVFKQNVQYARQAFSPQRVGALVPV